MTTRELVELILGQLHVHEAVGTVELIGDDELGVELADGGRFFVSVESAD